MWRFIRRWTFLAVTDFLHAALGWKLLAFFLHLKFIRSGSGPVLGELLPKQNALFMTCYCHFKSLSLNREALRYCCVTVAWCMFLPAEPDRPEDSTCALIMVQTVVPTNQLQAGILVWARLWLCSQLPTC